MEFKYSRTPLYGHPRGTDTWLLAVTSPLNSTRLIRTLSKVPGFDCILA